MVSSAWAVLHAYPNPITSRGNRPLPKRRKQYYVPGIRFPTVQTRTCLKRGLRELSETENMATARVRSFRSLLASLSRFSLASRISRKVFNGSEPSEAVAAEQAVPADVLGRRLVDVR